MSQPAHSAESASPEPEFGAAAVRIAGLPALELGAVLALAAVVFSFHLGSYGLWEPDEARYAEIAREMLATRDFVVPHLNYVAYVEKPPLLYWLTALSFSVFGPTEFAARLWVAIAAIGGVLATYIFTLRTFGRGHAMLAGAILATAPLYAVMAQVLTTDMLLTALVTVAMFSFYLHWREGGRWCWIFYAAMGLAILAKGPVGAALPIIAALVFLAWQRDLGAVRRFQVIPGLALTIVIAAPWFIVIAIREPGFFDFYFVGEHLRRAFESDYSHGGPFWYYVPVVFIGLLPYSMLVPFLTWRAMTPNPARRFCVAAAVVIFALFSLAGAKLVPYVLPAMAPLSVLLADGIISCAYPDRIVRGPLRVPDSRILTEAGPLLGLLGAGAFIAGVAAPSMHNHYAILAQPAIFAAGAVLTIGGVAVAAAFYTRRTGTGLIALVLVVASTLLALSYARIEVEPERSYARLSRAVAQRAGGATLICYHRYVQALPFYTGRRVILVGGLTELRFGAQRAPDRHDWFFTTDAELMHLWQQRGDAVLVIDAADLLRLQPQLEPFTVIAAEGRKRAILKSREPIASN